MISIGLHFLLAHYDTNALLIVGANMETPISALIKKDEKDERRQ